MNLVFLLEERSMKELLAGLLPRVLPEHVTFELIPHNGKSDLDRSIPRKLRGWLKPKTRFVIVRDQDSADCTELKKRLVRLCQEAGRPDTLVRIVCREAESWYLADLQAVDSAWGTSHSGKQMKRMFRAPDHVGSPSRELKRLVPEFEKVSGARTLGPLLDLENDRSTSFRHFIEGIRRTVGHDAA